MSAAAQWLALGVVAALLGFSCGRAPLHSTATASPAGPTAVPSPASSPPLLRPSPIPVELIMKTCVRAPGAPAGPTGGLTVAQAFATWMGAVPPPSQEQFVCGVAGQLREFTDYGDGSRWVWKLVTQRTTTVDSMISCPAGNPGNCPVIAAGSQLSAYEIVDYYTGVSIYGGSPAVCSDKLVRACYLPPA